MHGPGTGQQRSEHGCAGDSDKQPRSAGAAHFHNDPAHQPCPSRELTHHSPVSTSSTSSTTKPMPHYRQILPLCKCWSEVLLSPGEPRNGRRGVRIGTATHRRAARSVLGMDGQRLCGRASPVASPQNRTRAMWSSAAVGPGRPRPPKAPPLALNSRSRAPCGATPRPATQTGSSCLCSAIRNRILSLGDCDGNELINRLGGSEAISNLK